MGRCDGRQSRGGPLGERLVRALDQPQGLARQRHIVIGINDVGLELVRRMQGRAVASKFMGYFDFREAERLPGTALAQLKGHARDVADYVREHGIHSVYIALPISNASRIQDMLTELRDTTASVYFVPDIFSFDLVQPRFVEINGMPALSVTETPLQGLCGLRKRAHDIALRCWRSRSVACALRVSHSRCD